MTSDTEPRPPAHDAAAIAEIATEAFDKNGIPFALGDVVKVFHFVGARRKRHFMYKQVVGERTWPSGFRCWLFSHLNLKQPEERDSGFYVAREGKCHPDYEIVQSCGEYPAHFSTRERFASLAQSKGEE